MGGMAIQFAADLHLNHPKVAELRGFASVEDHDRIVLANLARNAHAGTITYLVGDVAMGLNKMDCYERLRRTVPGVLRLILGNHDPMHPGNSNAPELWQKTQGMFASVGIAAKVNHAGQTYLVSHFPYDGDHTDEERFGQWRLRDLGAPLIHGHTHSSERRSLSSGGTPQVCVSIDAWGLGPATLGSIASELSKP